MIWPTVDDIMQLHSAVIRQSGGLDGIRDQGLLEAAIAAPFQSFGGEDLFPTVIDKIVRLGFGLASNHAFLDGNKRIGAMATETLLIANGYTLTATNDEVVDMFLAIADGSAREEDLLEWTKTHLNES